MAYELLKEKMADEAEAYFEENAWDYDFEDFSSDAFCEYVYKNHLEDVLYYGVRTKPNGEIEVDIWRDDE